jgi:hypothetical protein
VWKTSPSQGLNPQTIHAVESHYTDCTIPAHIQTVYKVCLKSNATGAKNFLLTNKLKINIIRFNAVPLGSHTLPETLLPLPIAVLEVFMWKCPQIVCHDHLDVVHSSKMKTFEVEFEFREKEEVKRTQTRQVWGLQNQWNMLFGQQFIHRDGNVTGSIVIMQHPSVCMPISSVKMLWTV